MTNKTTQVLLLIIAAVTLFGGAFGTIAVVARYTGSIETKVEQTGKDIAEIKSTLRTIAPPTVRTAQAPEATTGEGRVEQGAVEQDALPGSWHSAYIADHCKNCPSCCATAVAGDP